MKRRLAAIFAVEGSRLMGPGSRLRAGKILAGDANSGGIGPCALQLLTGIEAETVPRGFVFRDIRSWSAHPTQTLSD
jgi:hypothetical protein